MVYTPKLEYLPPPPRQIQNQIFYLDLLVGRRLSADRRKLDSSTSR
jgi:hypothetical protein